MNDLKFAIRQLLKNPGFTAVAVLALALGIGANTAIFSVVNGVLLRPLSYPEPERLVELHESNVKLGFPTFSIAPGTFLDWQTRNHVFENLAALGSSDFNLTGLDKPQRVLAMRVSATFFQVLRVRPRLGRAFLPEEDASGRNDVVLLSRSFWLPYRQRCWGYLSMVARTTAEPSSMAGLLRDTVLAIDKDQPIHNIRTMDQLLVNSTAGRRFMMMLMGLFAGVALILCATGIYGLISYAVALRTHELGIRMALGAEVGDILYLVLRQGGGLALAGLALGLMGAWASTRLLANQLYEIRPYDPMTFALGTVTLGTVALLACFIPARRATKVDPMVALRYE